MNTKNVALPVLREDLTRYGKLLTNGTGYVAGQLEVTSRCFQHCKGCDSWREDLSGAATGEWDFESVQQLCRELASMPSFEHLSLTGGDPQAWPHLYHFLQWWKDNMVETGIRLQLNTALTQPLDSEMRELFRVAVDDLRISLDGLTVETYEKIRGRGLHNKGNCTNPEAVIERMCELEHPGLTTNTTVFPENIHEVVPILNQLNDLLSLGQLKIRKAHFLAVIGDRGRLDLSTRHFWDEWERIREHAKKLSLPTSVSENPHAVREALAAGLGRELRCWSGRSTFHIKCDGWVYPCCLVGGEALKTQQEFRLGNVHEEGLKSIFARNNEPEHHYRDKPICTKICQWKQLQLNMIGEAADKLVLAMP